jgi:acetaldehyde dehydrogenase
MIEKLTRSRVKERGLAVTPAPPAKSRQQPDAGAPKPSLARRRRARAWRGETTPIRSLGHRRRGGRKRPTGSPAKATAAIIGSGNVATDLLYKLVRSQYVHPRWMIGRNPASAGLARARELGLITSPEGLDWLLAQNELPELVFDATYAQAHASAAPRYQAAGIRVVDLTPAAVGPLVVPAVNLAAQLDEANVNMVTCAGQATVPIVHAIARVHAVRHAQAVVSIASGSAGPGTRANIEQLIATTGRALQTLGGAQQAETSIILDGTDPPLPMRASVNC